MEIKFQILTQDADGIQHNVGSETTEKAAKQLIGILMAGIEPNELVEIVIRPMIKK